MSCTLQYPVRANILILENRNPIRKKPSRGVLQKVILKFFCKIHQKTPVPKPRFNKAASCKSTTL